jgi:hypothetical protein
MSAHVEFDARSRPGNSLEARLLRRLLGSLGDPPIEFHLLWSDERVRPTAAGPLARRNDANLRAFQLVGARR